MPVTQVYKKGTCCNANCNQGRACPRKPDAGMLLANGLAAFAGTFVLAAPFAFWLLGYGG